MKFPHLSNGGKATVVGVMGGMSLIAAFMLACGFATGDGKLLVAGFTFFTTQAGNAMAYLMGSSQPDQHPAVGAPPVPPGQARVTVEGDAPATWRCACGAVVLATATECPACHAVRPA